MRATFLHMADCHLGYRQYNSRERQNDFTRAYLDIIKAAIDNRVDFVLMAGDLFEKRAIDPLTLVHAIYGLERLKEADIPCLAVEGNHERTYYRHRIGWMNFLAERQLLMLLNPQLDDRKVSLPPYRKGHGAYVEPVPGLRVYGMRYFGISTAHVVRRVADALAKADRRKVEYTIFMAHAGVEGVVPPQGGGVSHRELAVLRPYVDYLALGHIHKPYKFDNWIYNPGSPETNSLTESAWPKRGYYLVEVDTETEPKHYPVLHANSRRPFVRLFFKVDACETPDKLIEECRRYIKRRYHEFRGSAPVVELRLSGVLPFDRSALPTEPLKLIVDDLYKPLLSFVRSDVQGAEFAVDPDNQLSRPELERQIIVDLFRRDIRFRAHSAKWADLALAVKQAAINGDPADSILERLASDEVRLMEGKEMQC